MKTLLTIAALATIIAAGVFACPRKVAPPPPPTDIEEPKAPSEDASVVKMDAVVIDIGAKPEPVSVENPPG